MMHIAYTWRAKEGVKDSKRDDEMTHRLNMYKCNYRLLLSKVMQPESLFEANNLRRTD